MEILELKFTITEILGKTSLGRSNSRMEITDERISKL